MWTCENEKTGERYAALFNLSDEEGIVSAALEELGLPEEISDRELWTGNPAKTEGGRLSVCLPPHGCAVYRVFSR